MEVNEIDTFKKTFKGQEYFSISDTSSNNVMPKILLQLKRKFPSQGADIKKENFPFSMLFSSKFVFSYKQGIFEDLHIMRSSNASPNGKQLFYDQEYRFTRW